MTKAASLSSRRVGLTDGSPAASGSLDLNPILHTAFVAHNLHSNVFARVVLACWAIGSLTNDILSHFNFG